MASFIGTKKEFNRYIGPHLRNLVNQITRPYKNDIGKCEHCGITDTKFDAAHRNGMERPALIDKILSEHTNNNVITVDLKIFEEKFKELHYPIHKVILVLCRNCHVEYDNKNSKTPSPNEENIEHNNSDRLSIELEPMNVDDFKKLLLEKKEAQITVHYQNGEQEVKRWVAARFTQTSNVFGNLRSRPDFRQGNWQEKGISKVTVKVC